MKKLIFGLILSVGVSGMGFANNSVVVPATNQSSKEVLNVVQRGSTVGGQVIPMCNSKTEDIHMEMCQIDYVRRVDGCFGDFFNYTEMTLETPCGPGDVLGGAPVYTIKWLEPINLCY